MSTERAAYLDSSAIVKLIVEAPESMALHRYLRRRGSRVSSALAYTEVIRALLPLGDGAVRRGEQALEGIDLIRIGWRVITDAATLRSAELRSLDAIHLATARTLGSGVSRVVTYDQRMAAAAEQLGLAVTSPA